MKTFYSIDIVIKRSSQGVQSSCVEIDIDEAPAPAWQGKKGKYQAQAQSSTTFGRVRHTTKM